MFKSLISFKWMSKKFWLRLFLTLIAVIMIMKILGVSYMSDTMTIGAMGFISVIIGIYNFDKAKNKDYSQGTLDLLNDLKNKIGM